MLPLWLGVAPFAVAYAVTARAAHLSLLETQFMSLTVFAGASQFAAAGLFGQGAGGLSIIATTFLLNVRHVLYGLSLAQQLPISWTLAIDRGSGMPLPLSDLSMTLLPKWFTGGLCCLNWRHGRLRAGVV